MIDDDFIDRTLTGMLRTEFFAHCRDLDDLHRTEQYQSIVTYLRPVIKTNPREPVWYFYRAPAYVGLRQFKRALKDVATLISLIPQAPDTYKLEAEVKHAAGDTAGALQALETALRCDPNHPERVGEVAELQVILSTARNCTNTGGLECTRL